MKEKTEPKTDVGIIIGRFQCHELHSAHVDLINSVQSNHARTIVFLGVAPIRNTKNNPIDFKHRSEMIREKFPNIEIYEIHDNRSNEQWSKNLDAKISSILYPGQSASLYGGRDSFISSYSGKYKTIEMEPEIYISASQIRKSIINNYKSSIDFRAGLIAATGMHYPTAYQTVDAAIINKDESTILLAQKPGENKWRFVGGFSDPNSNSLEDDVKREVMEETGIEVNYPKYIGSTIIQDWRYRSDISKIKTAFFICEYIFGKPVPMDDISALKWFKLSELNTIELVEEHNVLRQILKENLKI